MAKPPPKTAPSTNAAPFHSPFAALGGLRDALPAPAETPVSDVSEAPHPASAKPAALGKLVLQREKKGRGGKTVTRVRGLPASELDRWATDMKRALGCGASVEDGEVILLGDLVSRAADWLEARGASRVVRGN
ncbi:MAG: translation initiation factor [Sandaracinaceae bacterium]|nr:translation initiation factor [Sandaracinaceae bacterium]MBP7681980.1 translation initiation factor [Deltaproteobacteria bacterium]MBK6813470.1 translation initiation factor [Sandaracinaceae bacterium]MBK7152955.1 translation initiation factor [Sandaracinaceae bacterium]MBK7773602.1 translation initiation factor [Sandaracinaceae bacterium]